MTRTAAREIAVQLIFRLSLNDEDAAEALDDFFNPEYYGTLGQEDRLFSEYPDEKQLSYIRAVASGVCGHRGEFSGYIAKYSSGWKLSRISKIAIAIMETAMFELLYMSDEIPPAAAINEAVETAKGYEEPETVSFINGILGSFYRESFPGAGAERLTAAAENISE
jgi:N utilization substance protein B